ncbi:hypothetical protein ACJX0J_028717, partial [Zea mays]
QYVNQEDHEGNIILLHLYILLIKYFVTFIFASAMKELGYFVVFLEKYVYMHQLTPNAIIGLGVFIWVLLKILTKLLIIPYIQHFSYTSNRVMNALGFEYPDYSKPPGDEEMKDDNEVASLKQALVEAKEKNKEARKTKEEINAKGKENMNT